MGSGSSGTRIGQWRRRRRSEAVVCFTLARAVLVSCSPAILSSRRVTKSVIVFDFGSAMLRVRVPILGTTPRDEFWSERGESVRDKGALGFAEDS
jgi:hypothetical protein